MGFSLKKPSFSLPKITAPKVNLPRIAIDKNTGKNIAKNINPGSADPTGMTNAINRGVSKLSTKDNLSSGLNKIGNSVANSSVFGQIGKKVFPNMMGGGSKGGQPGAAPAEQQYSGSYKPTSFSLSQDAATPSAIGANESTNAASEPIQRRYDLLNANLRGQGRAQAGMEQDALSRRFASMGASNSGAALRNSQLTANMGAKRLGEQSNVLAAQQSADQQGAIEAATGRNLQRDQLRAGENEAAAGRALSREQMSMQDRQFGQEFDLNKYITNKNLGMAAEEKRIQGRGINSLFGMLGLG
jgi:hypothetical protein